ncbi:hypothetical protein RB653_010596 [Dictyostelium firmibasis]|uniref:Uncharacterized protein n=1 Tax=Dictyostelium firmibasis TaxID=79012 RepID=A0AAN7TTZ6_9MYCE
MYKLSEPFDYENDRKFSQNDPISFWGEVAKKYVHWDKMYDKVYSGNEMYPDWFNGGKLNTCYNLLDINVNNSLKRDQDALIYECPYLKKTIKLTYYQLYEKVCEFSRVLLNLNICKDDNVLFYMPNIIEAPIAMLSCARIGATHCVLFDGCPVKSLIDRIETITPKLIITSNYGILNDEIIEFTPNLIKAIELSNYKPNNVITVFRNDEILNIEKKSYIESIPIVPNTLNWEKEINKIKENKQTPYYDYIPVESNHPLSILYTSGTTGNSKAVVRSNGGNLVGFLYYWDNVNPDNEKVFFSHSNIGWVSYHFSIIGSLSKGKTFIMFEGGVVKPKHMEDDVWEIIERHKVNIFFSIPKTIRHLSKVDPDAKFIHSKYDISSLNSILIGGEVIEESIPYYIDNKLNSSTRWIYGQTEMGCVILFDHSLKNKLYNTMSLPPPFVKPLILSEECKELEINQIGELLFKLPMPPCFATTFYKNEIQFKKILNKVSGYYCSGDLAFKNENGYYGIVSRADDQIKIGGFKVHLNDIDKSILKHSSVIECCSIGIYDQDLKNVPIGLLVLKQNQQPMTVDLNQLKNEINCIILNEMDFYSELRHIVVVPAIPKTKSGKIPRLTISKFLNEQNYQLPDNTNDYNIFCEIKDSYIKSK